MMANREGPEGLTLAASSKAVWWHLVTLIDMRTCSLYKDTSLKQYSIITLPSMYSNSAGLASTYKNKTIQKSDSRNYPAS